MNKFALRATITAGAIGVLALAAPVIISAAKAGVGLLAIGAIGVTGVTALQFLPLLTQKVENFVLKLRKAEARSNPIEQLQNFYLQKANQVSEFKQSVVAIKSQINNLRTMVAQRKRDRPSYDATSQEQSIKAMDDAYAVLLKKYERSVTALEELKVAIQDKEFEWKFSQAGQQAMGSLSALSGKEFVDAMLADEAFKSVTENFNSVFAELEMEANNMKLLESTSSQHIDFQVIDNKSKV